MEANRVPSAAFIPNHVLNCSGFSFPSLLIVEYKYSVIKWKWLTFFKGEAVTAVVEGWGWVPAHSNVHSVLMPSSW